MPAGGGAAPAAAAAPAGGAAPAKGRFLIITKSSTENTFSFYCLFSCREEGREEKGRVRGGGRRHGLWYAYQIFGYLL